MHFTLVVLSGCSASNSEMMTPSAPNPPSVPNPPSAPSGSGSNFTPVGNMITARANQIAVVLPNGKVLLAGGITAASGQVPYLATAELYDPFTGKFSPTGNLTTARGYPTAVLLNNGKVLVVGGAQVLSAELYDPINGIFTATGNMISGGTNNGIGIPLTLLPNGTVLVSSVPSQIYDPGAGKFSATLTYPDPNPLWLTTTLLLNGKALLNGCAAACGAAASELYDPATDAFTTTGTPKNWQNVYTATLLMNGKVLFVGSDPDVDNAAQAELYDPAAGTFTSLGYTGTSTPADFAAAVRFPNGTVMITGGQLTGGSGSTATDLYDPMSGNFTSAGNMTIGRHSHTATLLPDGTVLIAGGYSVWPVATSSAEIYKPTAP
jgi:hypothetical protein